MTDAQIARIAAAAADPNNWKAPAPREIQRFSKTPKRQAELAKEHAADLRYERQRLNVANLIDSIILSLIDLAPERLSWRVLELCECLISDDEHIHGIGFEEQGGRDMMKHMEVLTELISLFPPALYAEAMGYITALLTASSRIIASTGTMFVDRRSLERWGLLSA